MRPNDETIAALATAPYPAGVAIIRVSGPQTKTALRALFRSDSSPLKERRKLVFGEMIDYRSGDVIDRALAVFMPKPNSYTGEDVVEFQFHGSPVLVQKILSSLYSFGVKPAEPGEFTKRAFLNGKIDLVQAEAVQELIGATSERALRVASDHLKGRFSQAVISLGEPLLETLAQLEVQIDFPEEDIEPEKLSALRVNLTSAQESIVKLLETYTYGQLVKEGFRVLLCGRPNAGKSSLLNLLLGRQRAIVTEVSGTTRDLIEETASIAGYNFIFCDSAGLRDTTDQVERIGVELAKEKVGWADLVLFVADASAEDSEWRNVIKSIRTDVKKIWLVVNKIDLNQEAIGTFGCDSSTCAQNFYISVKTKGGLDALTNALVDQVQGSLALGPDASEVITNERHRSCLVRARDGVERVLAALSQKLPLEIISAELRTTLSYLDEIVGRTYTEDLLGRIFSKFCIGK